MSDALMSGRQFRTVNIIDNFKCEGLGIDISTSLLAELVTDYLNKIEFMKHELKSFSTHELF